MKKQYLLMVLVLTSVCAYSQQEAYIAPFRNDASGAYTLIHDDFGAHYARGIETYVDTMTFNRKLPICFAVITGECDQKDWTKANEMITHGHQVLNHSMYHKCGQAQDWCTHGDWNENDFSVEIDSSTSLIEQYTGKHPAFFIFPFDLFTDTMIHYLAYKNYLGARAGEQNITNPASLTNPFRLNFSVYRPEQNINVLNELVDKSIRNKTWGIRVMHGIQDDSWGVVDTVNYAKHLNHVQQQVVQHNLWVATLSDVVTYQYIKNSCKVQLVEEDKNGNVTKVVLEAKQTILPDESLLTNKTITLVLANTKTIPRSITQENKKIAFELRNGNVVVDIDPTKKEVVLKY